MQHLALSLREFGWEDAQRAIVLLEHASLRCGEEAQHLFAGRVSLRSLFGVER